MIPIPFQESPVYSQIPRPAVPATLGGRAGCPKTSRNPQTPPSKTAEIPANGMGITPVEVFNDANYGSFAEHVAVTVSDGHGWVGGALTSGTNPLMKVFVTQNLSYRYADVLFGIRTRKVSFNQHPVGVWQTPKATLPRGLVVQAKVNFSSLMRIRCLWHRESVSICIMSDGRTIQVEARGRPSFSVSKLRRIRGALFPVVAVFACSTAGRSATVAIADAGNDTR